MPPAAVLPVDNAVDQSLLFRGGAVQVDAGSLNALVPQQVGQKGKIAAGVDKIFGKPVAEGVGVHDSGIQAVQNVKFPQLSADGRGSHRLAAAAGEQGAFASAGFLQPGKGIGLQAQGQRDPVVEYKMSAFEMFEAMTAAITEDTVRILFHIRVEQKVEREPAAKVTGTNRDDSAVQAPKRREVQKIYPNDPCPCGSGKKYKQCCGRKPA